MSYDPSLIAVEDARQICEVDGATQDELLRELVLAATDIAESEARLNLKSRVYSATGDAPAIVTTGRGRAWLDLPYDPVTAVSKVEFLSSEVPETWTAVDLAAYPVSIDSEVPGRIFFRGLLFPYGPQTVRVSCTAGYAPVPEKLRAVVKQIVLHLYKQPQRQIAGVASRSFEGQTTTYLNEMLPKTTLLLLRQYARFAA